MPPPETVARGKGRIAPFISFAPHALHEGASSGFSVWQDEQRMNSSLNPHGRWHTTNQGRSGQGYEPKPPAEAKACPTLGAWRALNRGDPLFRTAQTMYFGSGL